MKNHLRSELKTKRYTSRLLSIDFILQYEKAKSDANSIFATVGQYYLHLEYLSHPPFASDLALSDCNLCRPFNVRKKGGKLSAEDPQTSRIVTMATRLLVATGPVVLPVEYLFYPLQEAVNVMDRFIPSSKQPQHWSRNYNGSHDRRRSNAHRRGSPVSEGKNTTSYGQGVTLRAEDLLGESENRLPRGSGISAVNFLSPRPGDRRVVLGGSATELTKCERPRAPLRRSSEGSYALRRKSSSSSNAADDPTSSDPSTSCTASSSSSSSESGESLHSTTALSL
ncbi:hypothetical protein CDAR_451671 [Caerostris darwini]|uniref:Uncharacterized protein n=1 Tax=Caerostris darwini TaxID=1538125 RepID=A0AAV4W010_9ARAC|nr:hypothetical protein CDAR_451671 [Caerostris darwini]